MLESLPPSVRSAVRFWAEVAGYGCGVAALLGLTVLLKLPLGQTYSLTQIGMALALATVAGVVASQCLPWKAISRPSALGIGARAGLRAGLIAAFVTGAALTAAATLRATTPQFAPEEAALKARMWITLAVGLAGILPGVFVGFLGGSFGAAIRERRLQPSPAAPTSDESDPADPRWRRWLSRGMLVCSLLAFLSPFIFLIRTPKPPTPSLARPGVPRPDAPPRFRYEKPPGFDMAEPGQFTIAARRPIPGLMSNRPIAISADGRYLAFGGSSSSDGEAITIIELDTEEEVARFPLNPPAERLAWLADSSRLFYVSPGPESRNGVLDLASRRVIPLPRPKNRDIPFGQMFWWSEKEVTFFPPDEPPLYYDLDELLLWPLAKSPHYQALPAAEKSRWSDGPRTSLASTPAWQLGTEALPRTVVRPPRKEPDKSWDWEGSFHLVFRDAVKSMHQGLPSVPLEVGDLLATTPDGSKLILQHGGRTEAIYFGLTDLPATLFSIQMPCAPENAPQPAVLATQLQEHALCAFLYAPMINPLNGRTIGPDREFPKAVLRFDKWSGESAEVYLAKFGSLISPRDVVADVHTWNASVMVLSESLADQNWWSPATPLASSGRAAAPDLTSLPHLDMGVRADLKPELLAFRLTGVNKFDPIPSPAPVPQLTGPSDEDVRAFVRTHHENESRGSVPLIMSSYAATIEFQGKTMSHDQLAQDKAAFAKRWNRVTETVSSPINVSRPTDSLRANYSVEYRHASDSLNKWQDGTLDMSLTLVGTADGLKIQRQSADVHKRGEGPLVPVEAPPPDRPVGMRPDMVGKYLHAEVTPTPAFNNKSEATLTIRESTWSYSIKTKIVVSERTPPEVRGALGNELAAQITTTYSGSIPRRRASGIDLRIDSVNVTEQKSTTFAKVHPRPKRRGEVWTFIRQNNGLVPEGQNEFFELKE